jgi:glycogen debranching enzyme
MTAYVKAHGRSPESRRQAAARLAPLREHLGDAGLGHVSEIFDGDEPHTPRGCIAQAWSVAEVLRAAVEDVFEPTHAERPESVK